MGVRQTKEDKKGYVIHWREQWEFWFTEEDAKYIQETYSLHGYWSRYLIDMDAYRAERRKKNAIKAEKRKRKKAEEMALQKRREEALKIANQLENYRDELNTVLNNRYETEKKILLIYCSLQVRQISQLLGYK